MQSADPSKTNKKVPAPLFKMAFTFYGLSVVCLCFAAFIYHTIPRVKSGWLMVGGFGLALAAFGTYLYISFRKGHYKTLDGVCIDSYEKGIPGRRYRTIVFCTADNTTWSFSVPAAKPHRILPGDKIYVYAPNDAGYLENDGVRQLVGSYGYERHP